MNATPRLFKPLHPFNRAWPVTNSGASQKFAQNGPLTRRQYPAHTWAYPRFHETSTTYETHPHGLASVFWIRRSSPEKKTTGARAPKQTPLAERKAKTLKAQKKETP